MLTMNKCMKLEALFDMSMNCIIFCFTMHISVEAFFTHIFMIVRG